LASGTNLKKDFEKAGLPNIMGISENKKKTKKKGLFDDDEEEKVEQPKINSNKNDKKKKNDDEDEDEGPRRSRVPAKQSNEFSIPTRKTG
jgi:hypothetical protein